jgi:hypothetical protein
MNEQLDGPEGSLLRFRYCWTTFEEAQRAPAVAVAPMMEQRSTDIMRAGERCLNTVNAPLGTRKSVSHCLMKANP